ncbi:uncharacterized protein B0H18DRAFT_889665 [Fomitopsis serialis]|uniref:uncharacterized protein n=1 Tax=Fomitopsis serialis TaxID=139415 RepID=UPI0020077056|nr:uncharacterized protein B0H18DRAFT_889665 [Neoantrodia serialis]KAH9912597.1 hypothetical protein B0H18DRAFT_889665 [Neoantrodia serialis]
MYAAHAPTKPDDTGSSTCEKCSAGSAEWKCLSCFGRPVFCESCCLREHARLPFHRLERWTDTFWVPSWLRSLGLQIHLGHEGSPCPCVEHPDNESDWSDDESSSESESGEEDEETLGDPLRDAAGGERAPEMHMTIVDTSAVHFLRVECCRCPRAESVRGQLLQAGLYPASQLNVKTCFTFDVLDDFLLDNLECKTSAMNYYRRLRRKTNPAFPHRVPDRYAEFMRATRQWTLLRAMMQFGFGPKWRGEPGTGDLALFCAACPQPGVNIPDDWDSDPNAYIYARGYVMDGNFSAEHTKMRKPGNDVPLMPGKAFMVTDDELAPHLKSSTDIKMKPTCNDHQAIARANAHRHKLQSTGIGATACSRHGCFFPHGVVNFQAGERQKNMDYTLSEAMSYRSDSIRNAIVLYDVMCQYGVHLPKRFKDGPCLRMPRGLTLYLGIGLFHVHGHQSKCLLRHAPTFMRGAGQVDGEIVETLWSPLGKVFGSTRTMATSHRQETLDRHMNDWNWRKMVSIGSYTGAVPALKKRIAANRLLLESFREALEDQEAGIDDEILAQWMSAVAEAHKKRVNDVSVMDKFEVQGQHAPSRAEIQITLTENEGDNNTIVGSAEWMVEGMRIEDSQIALQRVVRAYGAKTTAEQRLNIAKQRKRLELRIERFLRKGEEILCTNDWEDGRQHTENNGTAAVGQNATGNRTAPTPKARKRDGREAEWRPLSLPSSYPASTILTAAVQPYAKAELELRIGQANDILHQLRILLSQKSFVMRAKVRDAKSQTRKTRAWADVHSVQKGVEHHARMYRKVRHAMTALGAPPATMRKYQKLVPDDLKISTAVVEPNQRGQRHTRLPWLWTTDVQGDMSASETMTELHRVHWFRARSQFERAEEEDNILRRELDSVRRYFDYEMTRWSGHAAHRKSGRYPGYAEVCRQRQHMYKMLHKDADTAYGIMYLGR